MGMIMYRNPLANAESLQREIDRLFGQWSTAAAPRTGSQGVRYGEDADNYYVEVVAPGYAQESLSITAEHNTLRIAGTAQDDAPENVRWHRRERAAGEFVHRLRLPADANRDGIAANYRNGILLVTVPKTPESKPRTIDVQVG